MSLMQQNHSEIARLRQQIDLEHEAAERALHSPAITAPHAYITARMEQVWKHIQALERIGGRDAVQGVLFEMPSAKQEREAQDAK